MKLYTKSIILFSVLTMFPLLFGCGSAEREAATRHPESLPAMALAPEELVGNAEMSFDMDEAEPSDGAPESDDLFSNDFNTETYDHVVDNSFLNVLQNPLSTFSIDVDTASYSNVRRFLDQGTLPPKGSVRIEEMINYFDYDYMPPTDGKPFATHIEIAKCPWAQTHQLARIALKGKVFEEEERPPVNLVFLLDVSGSMFEPNKLPLLKSAMSMLVKELSEKDYVAICVYAGQAGVTLPPTSCEQKQVILNALDQLQAGGSTAGGAGIKLAYKLAREHFVKGHTNRVILCTDGDFNVGVSSQSELVNLIEKEAKSGIFLTVLGFGMGNYKDSTLEKLADKGNGNYGYIDNIREAKKMLVDELSGTLITIAKDVKIQVEFNPAKVGAYRLVGYENRMLRAEDFNDDQKDAGEIGAGHTVTAFYELVPPGEEADNLPKVDPLKYQTTPTAEVPEASQSGEWLTVKLRFKQPEGDTSELIEIPFAPEAVSEFAVASRDFQFAASVAAFGMILRESPYKGTVDFETVTRWAGRSKGHDTNGYRAEYVQLLGVAQSLKK